MKNVMSPERSPIRMSIARNGVLRNALTVAAVLCVFALVGCASKTVDLKFSGDVPDTPHCEFMKDACKEAMEFQKRFEVMSGEEKQDAKVIMNAYVQQCQDAQELCRRSAEVK